MGELTTTQRTFVDYLVANGCTPTEAARKAGYASPNQEAYRLMRNEHVLAEVKALQNRLVAGSGCNLALKTLTDVMTDPKAPASARVSAARVMLDAAGMFAPNGDRDAAKPIHEMTYAELEAVVQQANNVIGERICSEKPTLAN